MHEPIPVSARLPLCSRTQGAHAPSLAMTLGSPLMRFDPGGYLPHEVSEQTSPRTSLSHRLFWTTRRPVSVREAPIGGINQFWRPLRSSRNKPSFSCATRSEKKNKKQSSLALNERQFQPGIA